MTQPTPIKAIIFDFDGTLTAPAGLDFPYMRQAIGCPEGFPILEFIDQISAPEERQKAVDILNQIEIQAAELSSPNAGAEALIRQCRDALHIPLALLTRNCRAAVDVSLSKFRNVGAEDFRVIITSSDNLTPKPAPDGVLSAAAALGMLPAQALMIGDYDFDIAAGNAAGATTVLLTNGDSPDPTWATPDFQINQLSQLLDLPCFSHQ